MSRTVEFVYFTKILLTALTDKKSGRRWNSRDLPSQSVERQQYLCLSVNIQNITWSGFNWTKRRKVSTFKSRSKSKSTVSPQSWHFWLCKLANLLHPGFQGVKWARDQPMPGPFPAPPPSQGKGPGNEVASSCSSLPSLPQRNIRPFLS